MNSYLTSGKQDNDNVEFDPLVNVPELPKSRTNQSTTSTIPHWFDISSGGVGLTARSNGTITIWDLNNGKYFLRFSSQSISVLFLKVKFDENFEVIRKMFILVDFFRRVKNIDDWK